MPSGPAPVSGSSRIAMKSDSDRISGGVASGMRLNHHATASPNSRARASRSGTAKSSRHTTTRALRADSAAATSACAMWMTFGPVRSRTGQNTRYGDRASGDHTCSQPKRRSSCASRVTGSSGGRVSGSEISSRSQRWCRHSRRTSVARNGVCTPSRSASRGRRSSVSMPWYSVTSPGMVCRSAHAAGAGLSAWCNDQSTVICGRAAIASASAATKMASQPLYPSTHTIRWRCNSR